MVSTTCCSLKAASVEMAASRGTLGRSHIPRTGARQGASHGPDRAHGLCPLNDLPQQTHMLYFAQLSTNSFNCSENFSIICYQCSPTSCTSSHPYPPLCPVQTMVTTVLLLLLFVMKLDTKLFIGYNSFSKWLPFHLSKCITTL